jgi:hypothetical protein
MELPIFNTYINFSRHQFCCFTIVPLFDLDKSIAWNRCLQHLCFKNLCKIAQASKNSESKAQHFVSDLLTHSWFHSMLFALSGYQFPYIVMNRCLYLSYRQNRDGRSVNLPNRHQAARKASILAFQHGCIWSNCGWTSIEEEPFANHSKWDASYSFIWGWFTPGMFISSAQVAASCSLEWSRYCSMFYLVNQNCSEEFMAEICNLASM